jgi:Domain of unknown function (DUF4157)
MPGAGPCAECAGEADVQAKLALGAVNDPLEHEADRVAEQVLSRVQGAAPGAAAPSIQRFSGSGGGSPAFAPESVTSALRGAGMPLDRGLEREMSLKFGHDFSAVRVHRGALAERSAAEVDARAYTVGNNIVFAAGQYSPASDPGRRLIAHELTHVVQQRLGAGQTDSGGSGAAVQGQRVQRQSFGSAPGSASASPSSASGSSPAPAAAAAVESIDVRATHIGGILSSLPIWHLFVIHKNAAGVESYYRGGPGGPPAAGAAAGAYGTIVSTHGAYLADTVDWSPGAPSVTVMSGAACHGKGACFAAELNRIDGTRTPYVPTGPNSNTVARTILAGCGVPQSKPVAIAPGWNSPTL